MQNQITFEEYIQFKNWIIGKRHLYKSLLIKEIWIRKFMNELGLYLKEIEYNPAGAMWKNKNGLDNCLSRR